MVKKKKILLLAVLIVAIISIIVVSLEKPSQEMTVDDMQKTVVTFAGSEYILDTAISPAERTRGLSGRIDLSEKSGMLFIFPADDYYGIWMKDMNFPIDIIWLDSDKRIVHIVERADPGSYPDVFYPRMRSRYVIELKAGEVEEKMFSVGDTVLF